MKESEIEKMLETICREEIEPPDHLVKAAKQKIKHNRLLNPVSWLTINMVIVLTFLINVLVAVLITVVLVLPGITWMSKVLCYLGSMMFFNVLTALVLLNREKVSEFFQELDYIVKYNQG